MKHPVKFRQGECTVSIESVAAENGANGYLVNFQSGANPGNTCNELWLENAEELQLLADALSDYWINFIRKEARDGK